MNITRRNAVTVKGNSSGPAMMFAHGYGCNQDMWRLLTPHFERDLKIVLFDYIGCGNSDASMYNRIRYRDLHGYALDIIEICDALELTDVTLVCHSVSSMIGVLAARKRPELFSHLVLIAPSPYYINDGEYRGGFDASTIEGLIEAMENNFTGWTDSITPVIMGNAERPHLTTELAISFCAMDREIAKDFGRITFTSDHRSDLPFVSVKCLILQCKDDPIAPEYVGQYVHRNVQKSEYVQLNATGHCPHLSSPEETAAAIRNYLHI